MKKLIAIVLFLMLIASNANAGFLLGYTMGRNNCSCTKEKNEIKELKEENNKLKDRVDKLIKLMNKQYERDNNNSKDS